MKLNLKIHRSLVYYFLIAGGIYAAEFALVGILGSNSPDYIGAVNYLVRIVGCVLAGILIRRFVFQNGSGFLIKFTLVALIIPVISTLIFLLLMTVFSIHFLPLKLAADIVASILSYFLLSKLLISSESSN